MRKLPESITKDLLEQMYLRENKSLLDIAKVLDKSIAQVSRYLKKFGIQTRPFSTKRLQPRLGAVLSEETKDKIRKGHLGKKLSLEHKAKIKEWMAINKPFQGKKHSKESKQKQSDKMSGRKLTPEHRAKTIKNLIFGDVKGEKSHGWKGGISRVNARLRQTKEQQAWNKQVKERDNYTCVLCGHYNKSNHADHIAPFALYPELRLSLDNGRTLCVNCHRKTDTYGGKSNKKHY